MKDSLDTWRELQTLFDLIDRTPESERLCVLEWVCADPAMRTRVLRMIHDANEDGARPATPVESGVVSLRFGPYQVLRVIGSGGMGPRSRIARRT